MKYGSKIRKLLVHTSSKPMYKVVSVLVVVSSLSVILPARPAHATGGDLCQYNGVSLCLYVNSFSTGGAVFMGQIQSNKLEFISNGGTFHNHPTGTLAFTGATNRCAAYDTTFGNVDVDVCNANYTIWAQDNSQTGYEYINRRFTQNKNNGHDWVLSSDNKDGDAAMIKQDGASGWYQRWVYLY